DDLVEVEPTPAGLRIGVGQVGQPLGRAAERREQEEIEPFARIAAAQPPDDPLAFDMKRLVRAEFALDPPAFAFEGVLELGQPGPGHALT
ncbi:hypothetical protein CATMIT_01977, partial [Catenibacterium mitsuokai DSM 15897]